MSNDDRHKTIRILIVDNQALVREGFAALLDLQSDIEIVGLGKDGKEAMRLTEELIPDVILIDVRMPGMSGIAATRNIHSIYPEIKIIILTTFDDDEYVFEALRSGAAGYLLKNADPEFLARAIRAVYRGESILDPAITSKVIYRTISGKSHKESSLLTERLSNREKEVLCKMAMGLTNQEIGEQLFLAKGTVKNHVSNILGKIEARDRTQAVRFAVEWGLLGE